MRIVRLPIDAPNSAGLADDAAVLQLWEEVHALLSTRDMTFIVGREETSWFGVSVDARKVIQLLRTELERQQHPALYEQLPVQHDPLLLELRITPSGASTESTEFPLDRFVEQLFLACNLALPGSCGFTGAGTVVRLDSELLAGAFHLGRIPGDESLIGNFWPPLEPVSFQEAWDWLHEDLSYDVQLAGTQAQKAVFTLLQLATRYPEDLDNILAVARVVEAIFGRGVRKEISRTVREGIEATFGRPREFPRWFNEFYDLRSRLIHGDTNLLRPGLRIPGTPEAFRVLEEHAGALEHGVRLLLAVVYRMIRLDCRDMETGRGQVPQA
jgi:hypothetical protein